MAAFGSELSFFQTLGTIKVTRRVSEDEMVTRGVSEGEATTALAHAWVANKISA